MDNKELSYRNYIYCPICGIILSPEIHGGTDGSLSGQWSCYFCENQFTFELLEESE